MIRELFKFKLMIFQSHQIDDFRRFPSLGSLQFAPYKELQSTITPANAAYECTFYANLNLYWPLQLLFGGANFKHALARII